MRFFGINLLGRMNDDDSIAVVDGYPKDFDANEAPVLGEEASAGWPRDARVYLDPGFKGVKVTSFLSNANTYIMVDNATCELIRSFCAEIRIEYLRFDLYNQKKRLHCRDCWVVNPLGSFDFLNTGRSEIKWLRNVVGGEVVSIGRVVLDKKKVKNAPQLFRIKEEPSFYVFGERLVDDLRRHKSTNLVLEELEVG